MTAGRYAIVIPAFNAASTIAETLNSVQGNDAIDQVFKVVLLDDCSTDDTVAVARKCWRRKIPLEVWSNPVNLKERRTTNAAIERLADTCTWTFILHADDVAKPHWLKLYFEAMTNLPETVVSICSSYDNWWPTSGRIVTGDEYPEREAVHVTGDRISVRDTIVMGTWWHLSGCAIRNKGFLEVGGFEPEMPQLGDLEWLNAAYQKATAFCICLKLRCYTGNTRARYPLSRFEKGKTYRRRLRFSR
jgi:glycosyltransferase involved in cell wall biosynthesis